MWTIAVGIAVLLEVGATRADEEESAVHVDCPSESAGEDCTADEAVVPGEAAVPVAPAAPAAVAAVAPAPAATTVSFRNDVGKKLRLVEARFTMDGEKLPVILTSAEPGKSYVIVSGAMKPGPHVVSARLSYRGDQGVFSYMKGYKLNVRSDQVLTAPAESDGQLHRRRQREQGTHRSARKTRGRDGRERRGPEVVALDCRASRLASCRASAAASVRRAPVAACAISRPTSATRHASRAACGSGC